MSKLNIKQVAELEKVDERTIYKWFDDGLKFTKENKVRYIEESDLLAFKNKKNPTAVTPQNEPLKSDVKKDIVMTPAVKKAVEETTIIEEKTKQAKFNQEREDADRLALINKEGYENAIQMKETFTSKLSQLNFDREQFLKDKEKWVTERQEFIDTATSKINEANESLHNAKDRFARGEQALKDAEVIKQESEYYKSVSKTSMDKAQTAYNHFYALFIPAVKDINDCRKSLLSQMSNCQLCKRGVYATINFIGDKVNSAIGLADNALLPLPDGITQPTDEIVWGIQRDVGMITDIQYNALIEAKRKADEAKNKEQ